VVKDRGRGLAALQCVVVALAGLSLASCHSTTILYKPPPSATPANSASVAGSSYSRNAFNNVYNCVEAIDGVQVGSPGPYQCKHLAGQTFLIPPGQHSLTLAVQWESGQYTSGSSRKVTVELAGGLRYSVRGEEMQDPRPGEKHKVAIWLEDSSGAILGDRQEATFEDPEKAFDKRYELAHPKEEDRFYQMSQHNPKPLDPIGLPEINRLLVYSDFGNQSQPFDEAFTRRFETLAASCGIGVKLISVPHATKLSLDPAKMPPDEEIRRIATADGADQVLKIKVLEWAGGHAPSSDLASPLSDGRFNIEVTLRRASGGDDLWHPYYFLPSVARGGADFAENLMQAIDKHGAVPHCPPFPKPGAGAAP